MNDAAAKHQPVGRPAIVEHAGPHLHDSCRHGNCGPLAALPFTKNSVEAAADIRAVIGSEQPARAQSDFLPSDPDKAFAPTGTPFDMRLGKVKIVAVIRARPAIAADDASGKDFRCGRPIRRNADPRRRDDAPQQIAAGILRAIAECRWIIQFVTKSPIERKIDDRRRWRGWLFLGERRCRAQSEPKGGQPPCKKSMRHAVNAADCSSAIQWPAPAMTVPRTVSANAFSAISP